MERSPHAHARELPRTPGTCGTGEIEASAGKLEYWKASSRLSAMLAQAAKVCDEGEINWLYRQAAQLLDELTEKLGSEPL